MKAKLKLIAITVVATTVAWAVLLACLPWWFSRPPEGDARLFDEFSKKPGALGGISIPNNKSNATTVVIEALQTNSETIERVELTQTELPPRTSILIGVRDVSASGQGTNQPVGANGTQPPGSPR